MNAPTIKTFKQSIRQGVDDVETLLNLACIKYTGVPLPTSSIGQGSNWTWEPLYVEWCDDGEDEGGYPHPYAGCNKLSWAEWKKLSTPEIQTHVGTMDKPRFFGNTRRAALWRPNPYFNPLALHYPANDFAHQVQRQFLNEEFMFYASCKKAERMITELEYKLEAVVRPFLPYGQGRVSVSASTRQRAICFMLEDKENFWIRDKEVGMMKWKAVRSHRSGWNPFENLITKNCNLRKSKRSAICVYQLNLIKIGCSFQLPPCIYVSAGDCCDRPLWVANLESNYDISRGMFPDETRVGDGVVAPAHVNYKPAETRVGWVFDGWKDFRYRGKTSWEIVSLESEAFCKAKDTLSQEDCIRIFNRKYWVEHNLKVERELPACVEKKLVETDWSC